ncbi:hypothetical protein KC19_10G152000 [Ceratodon purpureus]|uniref:Uncharacterized protein n=1 Tax=Ceratodon purpureus TaxID=3225 RepID=A0A8T0GNA2_CERPU|nr:hypothetical protein KC19_10G152000 [Ceratodon purpureus]
MGKLCHSILLPTSVAPLRTTGISKILDVHKLYVSYIDLLSKALVISRSGRHWCSHSLTSFKLGSGNLSFEEIEQLLNYLIDQENSKGFIFIGHSTGCQVVFTVSDEYVLDHLKQAGSGPCQVSLSSNLVIVASLAFEVDHSKGKEVGIYHEADVDVLVKVGSIASTALHLIPLHLEYGGL